MLKNYAPRAHWHCCGIFCSNPGVGFGWPVFSINCNKYASSCALLVLGLGCTKVPALLGFLEVTVHEDSDNSPSKWGLTLDNGSNLYASAIF